ncbi:MAG: DUF4143 domain-containing protein [Rhodoglobus sp.]|nr:DUF4143 domain-containing protein [Rhodoglobus sp.]
MPGIVMAPEPTRALQAYISLYLREEIKAEGLVRNLSSFGRFLEAMSLAQGQPLNLANVSRECEVSRATVDGYLEVLEDMLLGSRLPVFTRRAQRQLVGHPKFHWFDAGVFRSVRPAVPLDAPEGIEGQTLEGLVAQHLRAWIDCSVCDLTLSYYFCVSSPGARIRRRRSRSSGSKQDQRLRPFLVGAAATTQPLGLRPQAALRG